MSLYLYIPPLEIMHYWYQKNWRESVHTNHLSLSKFTLIISATFLIVNINTRTKTADHDNNPDSTIYIHWWHHPHDMSKPTMNTICNRTIKDKDLFSSMKIAVSQPRSLSDDSVRPILPL